MGPYASQILADLGADVVKLEPKEGDIARHTQPRNDDMGAMYANCNRNKKSLALDLKTPEGKEIFVRLAARSDVLLHNMRDSAAARLGIDFLSVVRTNPRIIYCATAGFGKTGCYGGQPAFDDTIQAASGLAALVGKAHGDDIPRFVPTVVADKVAALHAVYGILAALVARNRDPGPYNVEVPMFETLVAFLLNEHLADATFHQRGTMGYGRVLSTHRKPFATADGWIAVLPYTEEQWRRFLVEIGREDVLDEAWFATAPERAARIDHLYELASHALQSRATAAWLTRLRELDVPVAPVNSLEDLLDDPHLKDVGFFNVGKDYPSSIVRALRQPVRFHGSDETPDSPPPQLGQDTRALLTSCGYSEDEIDKLTSAGVVLARDAAL